MQDPGNDGDSMPDETLNQPATRRDLLNLEVATRGDLLALEARVDKQFEESAARVDKRFEQIDRRFEQIDGRFEQIDGRFEQIDRRFEQIDGRFDELRRHFDLTSESFKAEFRNLFDWVQATTSTLEKRLDRLEKDHHARVGSVELRVTRLERHRKH